MGKHRSDEKTSMTTYGKPYAGRHRGTSEAEKVRAEVQQMINEGKKK